MFHFKKKQPKQTKNPILQPSPQPTLNIRPQPNDERRPVLDTNVVQSRPPLLVAPSPTVPLNPDSMFRMNPPFDAKSRTPTPPQPSQQASPPPTAAPYQPSYLAAAESAMPYRPLSVALDDLTFGGTPKATAPVPAPKPSASPKPLPTMEIVSPNIPTIDSLRLAQRTLSIPPNPSWLPWIRDVVFLIEQHSVPSPSQPGTAEITHPILRTLTASAASALIRILSGAPPHPSEAMYLHGLLGANGAVGELIPFSRRDAFRDWENAAMRGWNKAWFRLGRDYESVGDFSRARDCFEHGVKAGVESCIYRIGIAKLLGQLAFIPSPTEALPLLQEAANLSSIETPHPAYVFALILRGEFAAVKVEERLLAPFIPEGSTSKDVARSYLERAAYFGFVPAQYKVGRAYEYAEEPFTFDPLRSVQYYSLASQQGDAEADMALSKWFLCGHEGAFDKDEGLAVRFADKAARKGLPTAEFAMGYYAEIGIGMPKHIDVAREWYTKAAANGNLEAQARLSALSTPAPQALSRTEHEALTDQNLVRRRTQAKVRAAKLGRDASKRAGAEERKMVVGSIRAGVEGAEEGGKEATIGVIEGLDAISAPVPEEEPPIPPVPAIPPQSSTDIPRTDSPAIIATPPPPTQHPYPSPLPSEPPLHQASQSSASFSLPTPQHSRQSSPQPLPPGAAPARPPNAVPTHLHPQPFRHASAPNPGPPPADTPRYQLSDTPSPAGTPPNRSPRGSPAPGGAPPFVGPRAPGRPPGRRIASESTPNGYNKPGQPIAGWEPQQPPYPHPPPHPAHPVHAQTLPVSGAHAHRRQASTFEEMGFKTGKATKEDCRIM